MEGLASGEDRLLVRSGEFPWDQATREECRAAALAAVESKLEDQLDQIWNGQGDGGGPGAFFHYPTLAWTNVDFVPGVGLTPLAETRQVTCTWHGMPQTRLKYKRMLALLQIIRRLLVDDSCATKRELYYRHLELFPSQADLDRTVSVVCVLLQVPRNHLRIFATSKGLVAGNVAFVTADDRVVDCSGSTEGQLIPHDVKGIKEIRSNAKALLIVEKDATFQALLDDPLFSSHLGELVVVTGKGVPDLSTRQLVHRLAAEGLPASALVDCDPFGVEIMFVYKYGSLAMAWSAERTAVPSIQWIGVLPNELIHLEPGQRQQLSEVDNAKLQSLLARPYVRPYQQQLPQEQSFHRRVLLNDESVQQEQEDTRHQLEVMSHLQAKAEIESLDSPARYVLEKLAGLSF